MKGITLFRLFKILFTGPQGSSVRCCLTVSIIGMLALLPSSLHAVAFGAYGRSLDFYPGTYEQQLNLVKDAGLSVYRVDLNSAEQFPNLDRLLATAKPKGLSILPNLSIQSNVAVETEEVLYRRAYDYAKSVVGKYQGEIKVWEMGNELEQNAMVRPGETMDDGSRWSLSWGDSAGDESRYYIAARYNKARGIIRGLCDGAHAASPEARCIVNTAGSLHYGFLQRLISDGVVFDIVGYHWYSHMGSLESSRPDESGLGVNVLAELAKMGMPIWITESNRWTGTIDGNEKAQADDVVGFAKQMASLSSKYNIQAVIFYELCDEHYFDINDFEAHMGLVNVFKDAASGSWFIGAPKLAYIGLKEFLVPVISLQAQAQPQVQLQPKEREQEQEQEQVQVQPEPQLQVQPEPQPQVQPQVQVKPQPQVKPHNSTPTPTATASASGKSNKSGGGAPSLFYLSGVGFACVFRVALLKW